MLLKVRQTLAVNGGLILRSEALDCGLTPSRIALLLKAGDLVWIDVRGVYADGELWRTLDDYRGKPLLRVRAHTMLLQRGWVLSHDSAALELEMPLIAPHRSLVHVTRPGFSSAWTRGGVKRHYARFAPSQLRESPAGFRCLSIARTAVDLAREHGETAGIIACDWALRHGVPRSELLEAVTAMTSWPGVVGARGSVDFGDPRAESIIESMGRELVAEAGLGPIDLQFPLQLDRKVAWCDLRVGNHVFECHGKVKLVPVEKGGVATTSPEDVEWEEKKRARLIRGRQLGVSDIVYADFWGEAREAAKKRLRADYEVSRQRFGDELHPELAADAERLRKRYGWRDRPDPRSA